MVLSFCLLGYCWLPLSANAETSIRVNALLKNMVVMDVNGRTRTLKVGQTSPEGVRLISADSRSAVVEVDGERKTLTLSMHVSGRYTTPDKRRVTIRKNSLAQFKYRGMINGKTITMLVDTGANIVALSREHAEHLGLDYRNNASQVAVTASGQVRAFPVILNSIQIGDIRVDRVEASVIDSNFPVDVLLGMSFLRHVRVSEIDGLMTLEAKTANP